MNSFVKDKLLAIIPARGGSKRIPRKNIKHFLGKPIIAYSIETSIESKLFDEVMVSTDDKEIAEISKSFGAKVPFYRSKQTSDDFATTSEVLLEVLKEYSKRGKEYDNICCIYPTAPFITVKRLIQGLEILINNNFDSVFPVSKFSYPIQRALKIENNKIHLIWPENLNKRSQDLMPAYHDSGQFYWLKTKIFLKTKKIFTGYSGAIHLNEIEVQDIDNKTDWELAEIKYKFFKEKDIL